MQERIRVGIAGFGDSARVFNAPFLDADEHFIIKKVYERTTQHSRQVYPYVEVVRSFDELLTEDIDLVVLSTPNQLHYSMAKQAILAGKNVITDKPAAQSGDQVRELMHLAEQKEVLYTVYQNRRFDGPFLTVCALVEKGILGKIVDFEIHFDRFVPSSHVKTWKRKKEKGVGALYDVGVHHIDQIVCLFGKPSQVFCDLRIQREGVNNPDNAHIALYYPDGLKAVVKISNMQKIPGPYMAVHGTKGSYIKQSFDVQEARLKQGVAVDSQWGYEDKGDWGELDVMCGEEHLQGRIETHRSHWGKLYENVYRALMGKEALYVKPEQAAYVLDLIEACEKSAVQGCKIDV